MNLAVFLLLANISKFEAARLRATDDMNIHLLAQQDTLEQTQIERDGPKRRGFDSMETEGDKDTQRRPENDGEDTRDPLNLAQRRPRKDEGEDTREPLNLA